MTGVLIGRHQDADTHRDDLAKMERQPSTSPEGGLRETALSTPWPQTSSLGQEGACAKGPSAVQSRQP